MNQKTNIFISFLYIPYIILLEYCEGFLEIINTVDERIELESRLKVYQEMYANMNGEMERLKTNQTKLNNQVYFTSFCRFIGFNFLHS